MKKNIQNIVLSLCFSAFLISCNDTQKTDNQQVKEEVKQKPAVYEFGFNLDENTIVKDTIRQGDTFGGILSSHNIGATTIDEISKKTKDILNPSKIKAKSLYALVYDKKNPAQPHSFVYQPNLIDYIVVKMTDSIHAYKMQRKVTFVEKQNAGFIKNNLIESALDAGLKYNVAFNLSQIFDYTVDFFQLQRGDNFKIIYEERYVEDTIYAGISKVKAAFFEHKGTPYYAFNFTTDSIKGESGFYDEKGNTMKRMFLKAPLDIFRITSRFGMRFHPVLHRMKGHFGTDYAAPTGTPIRTTASGTVLEAGYAGGNGNYVKIRHNATYTTQYLHMSKILVKRGQHVTQGQVIGLVGSTGLSSGPHVCYRFWKNGVQVDPLKEKMPESVPIDEKLKEKYLQFISPLKTQIDALIPQPIENEQVTEKDSVKNQSYENQ